MKTKKKQPKFVLPQLERSYLIQRLSKPFPKAPEGSPLALLGDNPFAFGGGLRNGGLSDNAMDLIRDIFRFDYMGASEFEWGAVPKALQKIAQMAEAGVLTAFTIEIPYEAIEKPFRYKGDLPTGMVARAYVLCAEPWKDEVERRIRYYAANAYGKSLDYRLLEITMLNNALIPQDERDSDRCGWLELDNGYMFFTDETMWAKTCDLFGVSR